MLALTGTLHHLTGKNGVAAATPIAGLSIQKPWGGFRIVGEYTTFTRAEWKIPTEKRFRGVLVGDEAQIRDQSAIEAQRELTVAEYLNGRANNVERVCFFNSTQQLEGAVYDWVAISSGWARRLGWKPAEDVSLGWCSPGGELRIKSVFWRDGWTGFAPPEFDPVGEGWMLLASQDAVDELRAAIPTAREHLWIKRFAIGDDHFERRWHLSRPL
jgi:hypothetical protein